MDRGIRICKVWSDDDVVELNIYVSDGTSCFANKAYVGHARIAQAVSDLNVFKGQVHGGLLDIRLGEFGPEYANGAFHARFHLLQPGRLYITSRQESEFVEFAEKTVASCATLHVQSEPGLLDRFIVDMGQLASGQSEEACLEAV